MGIFGGGGGDVEVKNEPWGGVSGYLREMTPWLREAYTQPTSYYPGQTYADLGPVQQAAQQYNLGYAGYMMPALNNTFGAYNWGMNAPQNVMTDPLVNRQIQSAMRPVTQQYQEQVMPSIQRNAIGAGNYGGSRQGVAEGLASRSYMDTLGDISTGIYSNAYNKGMDQQARMMALGPQVFGMGMMPGQMMGQVGAQNQQQTQKMIDDAVARWNYGQTEPVNRMTNYWNTLWGAGGGTQKMPDPNASNPLSSAIGGGLAGAGTAGMLELSNPWMAGLGALGAIGGLFG